MDRTERREEVIEDHEHQGLQRMVVLEVMRGCQLAQDLERKVKLAPFGALNTGASDDDNAVLRRRVIGMAASIVTTFSNVISYLHSDHSLPCGARPRPSTGSCLGSGYGGQEVQKVRENSSPSYSSNLVCSAKSLGWPNSVIPSPLPSPPPIQTLEEYVHPSPPLCHTPTPPQSPSAITSAKRSAAQSPQLRSIDLDSATEFPKEEFEPIDLETALDPENSSPAETSSQGTSKKKAERMGADANEQISIAKRRKCMPKWTVVVPSGNTEQGSEAVPVDSYTWRKYGQKDILGSRHPRSYYRCTHKTEMGCLAIKYVQKSDEDPPVYHVTYKGEHTCRPSEIYRPHSNLYPRVPVTDSHSRLPFNSTCLTLGFNGALQLGQFGPTSSPANNFQLAGQTASSHLLKTQPQNSDNTLLLRPSASFSLPEFDRTPKFGFFSGSGNADLRSADFHGAKIMKSEGTTALMVEPDERAKVRLLQGSGSKLGEGVKLVQHPHRILEVEDEFRHYDSSSAHPSGYECPGELLSPSASEVVSNCVPLELIQRSFAQSKSAIESLTNTILENPPQIASESEISEVVAENMPDFRFDLDSFMDIPYNHQHMLDLLPLNHELF